VTPRCSDQEGVRCFTRPIEEGSFRSSERLTYDPDGRGAVGAKVVNICYLEWSPSHVESDLGRQPALTHQRFASVFSRQSPPKQPFRLRPNPPFRIVRKNDRFRAN
jgi:hypothetical protein